MNVLIVAATEAEIGPFAAYMERAALPPHVSGGILVTGVGMLATAYMLTKHLQQSRYDLVLQVGVGGSFNRDLNLGEVVFVISDQYGDLGAEDRDNYMDIFEMGLIQPDAAPHIIGKLITPLLPLHNLIELTHVSGITVNTVSGHESTIARRYNKYLCDVESMEGAALHYVCLREKAPFAQVRAISNYVIPRDKSQWKMKEAIINLNNWLIDFIERL